MRTPDRLYSLILDYQRNRSGKTFAEILLLVDDLVVSYTNDLLAKYEFLEAQEVYHLGIIALDKALRALNVEKYSTRNLPYYLKRYFEQEVRSFLFHQYGSMKKVRHTPRQSLPDLSKMIWHKLAAETIESIIKTLCKEGKLTPLDIALFRDKVLLGIGPKALARKYHKQEIFVKKRLERMLYHIRREYKRQVLFSLYGATKKC